jgi:DNA repair protein RecN (Recombination protein N)
MKRLVELDPSQQQHLDSLDEAIVGLTDVARIIHAYSGSLEYDPKRLEEIESRLDLIRGLKRKYGQNISEVLEYLAGAETELETVSHSAERGAQLEGAVTSLRGEMGQMAHQLSGERSRAVGKLVTEVKKQLHDLNMPQVEFDVSIGQERAADGIPLPDGETYAFGNDGVDTVEFMVSTNPGEPLKPLARIASTGEISRFTLALKGALSEADNIPVLIFDEIDIGVGGRSGQVIGQKLWALARTHQVVCVTHLPQVAAFADAHFSVHKETSGSRTLSVLEDLGDEARVEELATMLAGPQHTGSSSSNARELARKAEKWKKLYPKGL